MMPRIFWPIFLALTVGFSACASVETPSPVITGGFCPDDPSAADDPVLIEALLANEGSLVVAQDLVGVVNLWHPDGRVIDAKHTPADTRDDQSWHGRDAIRYRYQYWVFPGGATAVSPKDLTINLQPDVAVVTATTQIEGETAPGGDRWTLRKVGDCWFLTELTYNLEE